jgi:hypothetical protein
MLATQDVYPDDGSMSMERLKGDSDSRKDAEGAKDGMEKRRAGFFRTAGTSPAGRIRWTLEATLRKDSSPEKPVQGKWIPAFAGTTLAEGLRPKN